MKISSRKRTVEMSGFNKNGASNETKSIAIKTRSAGYNALIVEHREQVLIIKFNRPQARNALNRRAYYELIRILQSIRFDPTITVVVLTGVGDAFTVGNDLTDAAHEAAIVRTNLSGVEDMETKRLRFNRQANSILQILFCSLIFCPKILVALVNGVSCGIGFTLAALCDIVYCTESAYFEAPFARFGLCPEMSASMLFPTVLGRSKAAEVLLFGARLNAEDAYNYGFVARVFKTDEVETIFWPKIFEYSQLPTQSLENSKRLLNSPIREELLKAITAEFKILQHLRFSNAHLNAIDLFFQNHRSNKCKL